MNINSSTKSTVDQTQLWLFDFQSGRKQGGHDQEYLTQLILAVSSWQITVIAPYLEVQVKPRDTKIARVTLRLEAFLGLFRKKGSNIAVFHTPVLLDFVLYYATSKFTWRKAPVSAVFFLRRLDAGMIGSQGWKTTLMRHTIKSLAMNANCFFVSDCDATIKHWENHLHKEIMYIPLPPRNFKPHKEKPKDTVTLGLLGLFRLEKGADKYDSAIRYLLNIDRSAKVFCQLPDTFQNLAEEKIAMELRANWGDSNNVIFLPGYLASEEYTNILQDVHIVLLPYRKSSYQSGSSGLFFDAHLAGAVIISTPFHWAKKHYSQDDQVIWLNSTDDGRTEEAIKEAHNLATTGTRKISNSSNSAHSFVKAWNLAIIRASP